MITNLAVPVVGAILVVIITLCNYGATKWLETQRPASDNSQFIEKSQKLQFADLRFFPPANAKSSSNKRRQLVDPEDKLRSRIHGSASTPNLTKLDPSQSTTAPLM